MSREPGNESWGDSLEIVRKADTLFPEVRRCCATCLQWGSRASFEDPPATSSCAISFAIPAPMVERNKYGVWEIVTDYSVPLVPTQTTALSLCTQHTYRYDLTVNGKPWISPSPKTPR